jgi:hypothetical protein
MSQLPPASLRLTSRIFNSPIIGTSSFYYSYQIKQNLSLKKAIQRVTENANFIKTVENYGNLPIIQPGILPIYTQLRAKNALNLQFFQSHYWFLTKTINCANFFVFTDHIQHPLKGKSLSPIKAIQLLCARYDNPLTLPNKSHPFRLPFPQTRTKSYKKFKRIQNVNPPLVESMFLIYCIRQMIAKTRHFKSKELVTKCINKLTFHFDNTLKKKLNLTHYYQFKFFDKINLEKMSSFSSFTSCSHFPKSLVDIDELDNELRPDDQDFHHREERLRVDHLSHDVKTNFSPKLLTSFGFNAPVLLHLFYFVEGALSSQRLKPLSLSEAHRRPLFQKQKDSIAYSAKIGQIRLKTGTVFELSLDLNKKPSRLRPTLSIRL